MRTIHITLQDPVLEQAVLRLTRQRHQDLQDFIITALRHYIGEIEQPPRIPKLDPFQHSQAASEPFRAILAEDVGAFRDVENSAEFGKKLRQRAWRDG